MAPRSAVGNASGRLSRRSRRIAISACALALAAGPRAQALVSKLGGNNDSNDNDDNDNNNEVPKASLATVSVAGHKVWAMHSVYSGEDGIELYVGADAASEVYAGIVAAGETEEFGPCYV